MLEEVESELTENKAPTNIKLRLIYLRAKLILCRHYDRRIAGQGRHFADEGGSDYTAPGWKWVVDDYISCKKARVNKHIPWPVSPQIRILHPENIEFHPDDLNNFQGIGNYYQAIGKITIGHGTFIAYNVGIITANHSSDNPDLHDEAEQVNIGEQCWIGMNSMILPGVTLGPHTVVGAGSVVTKSFPDGNCVIAGNPAKVIRYIGNEKVQ